MHSGIKNLCNNFVSIIEELVFDIINLNEKIQNDSNSVRITLRYYAEEQQ